MLIFPDVFNQNDRSQCPATRENCNFCGVLGHFQSVCRKEKKISSARKVATKMGLSGSESKYDVNSENVGYMKLFPSMSNNYENILSKLHMRAYITIRLACTSNRKPRIVQTSSQVLIALFRTSRSSNFDLTPAYFL